ncbi:MAG: VOC family protein [Bryobacteraceae bacterium]|nr:VOC family protein [Bryobacteraceae bacterium]
MFEIGHLFETHLTVSNLERAMKFYGGALGLPLAKAFPDRKVAFYWVGGAGQGMLGLWEAGSGPQRMHLHTAFAMKLEDVLAAPARLREAGITPLDFDAAATDQPVVLGWMPAAAVYFHDPDGNLLEFLAMLPETPRPGRGVVNWSDWDPA